MKLNSKIFSYLLVFLMCFSFALFNGLNTKAEETTKKITITKKWEKDEEDVRPDNVTVHLKKTSSLLMSGGVNATSGTSPLENKIKQIAGNGSQNANNTNITAIKYATEAEYNAKKTSLTSNNEIQDSGEKTYMWFDNGVIYFYSEAENIYLNTYSGGIFRKMTNLTNISGLSHLNTSYVQDMNRIFQDTTKLTDFSPIANWDVSHVQNFRFAFGANSPATNQFSVTTFEPFKNWDVSSVTDANQMFKAFAVNIDDMSPLKNWDLSSLQDASQMFNYLGKNTTITNLDVIEDWDVRRVTNFANMFNNMNVSSSNMPTFNLRPGSWNANNNGTYIPSSSALPAVTPASPGTPVLTTEYTTNASGWVKNGDTWTYEFTVPNDNSKYTVWEDNVTDYDISAPSNDPIKGVTDNATITNTNKNQKEINITTVWDDIESFRPDNIKLHLIKNGYDKVTNDSKWVKNGNTWTYKFYVYDNDNYSIYEEDLTNYNSDAYQNNPKSITNNSATITNELKKYDIVLNSIVTGNLADTNKEFEYKVTLYDNNDNLLTGNIDLNGETITLINGSFTKKLKHQESISLKMPITYKYKIEETDTNYNESFSINGNTSSGNVTNIITINNNQQVTFYNNNESSSLTGLFINAKPYFVLLLLGIIGLSYIYISKKIKIEI